MASSKVLLGESPRFAAYDQCLREGEAVIELCLQKDDKSFRVSHPFPSSCTTFNRHGKPIIEQNIAMSLRRFRIQDEIFFLHPRTHSAIFCVEGTIPSTGKLGATGYHFAFRDTPLALTLYLFTSWFPVPAPLMYAVDVPSALCASRMKAACLE